MDLPDLPPEKRAEVQRAAYERMQSGTTLMLEGLDQLLRAASTDDATAMQDAIAKVREGIARFDSGLAAHRASPRAAMHANWHCSGSRRRCVCPHLPRR